jgi:hypothetical protein
MEVNVKVHVRGSNVVFMQIVVLQILPSVSARLVIQAIHCVDVKILTNV